VTAARLAWRLIRLLGHILTGVVLTLVLARRDKTSGEYRHNPNVVSWWHDRLLQILGVEVEVRGDLPSSALLVANHVSWLDIEVLGALTHTRFLSKHEVREWPIIGWLAAAAGTLFIKRGGGQAGSISETISRHMDERGLLTLFPEGTTTNGSDVRPFFSRLFGAAVETRATVIPVCLRYHVDGERDPLAPFIDDQSLVDNLLALMRRAETHVQVSFLPALDPAGKDRKTIAEEARQAIRTALFTPIGGKTAPETQAAGGQGSA
jgi:1-acyl-sn-glycerol-3-phosphate acyltransferase